MSIAIAALLGVIQGLTEFLPVSSSGHVTLGALVFALEELSLGAVLVVHIGTLLATLLVLRKDIAAPIVAFLGNLRTPLATKESREAVGIILGSVPTAVIGLALRPMLKGISGQPHWIAAAFLVTAVLLLLTRIRPKQRQDLPLWIFFVIGVAQGIAVFPGISRSGATIATAMLLGVPPAAAFRISFLLSIPAIVGATILEASHGEMLIDTAAWISGLVAFATGIVALLMLRNLVTQGRLWIFAIYLVPAAALVFLLT